MLKWPHALLKGAMKHLNYEGSFGSHGISTEIHPVLFVLLCSASLKLPYLTFNLPCIAHRCAQPSNQTVTLSFYCDIKNVYDESKTSVLF